MLCPMTKVGKQVKICVLPDNGIQNQWNVIKGKQPLFDYGRTNTHIMNKIATHHGNDVINVFKAFKPSKNRQQL